MRLGIKRTGMTLCESNRRLSEEVQGFLRNVPDLKEESITDYLVWKWGEIDKRFNYLSIRAFTRIEESKTTGADFELELWLVGNTFRFPLLFQAKKLVKPFGSYVSKLNYPNGTQGQLSKLLSYSREKKRVPFYAFYSLPDSKTEVMCAQNDASSSGVFIADAYTVKEFADGKNGTRVSKNKLLAFSNPFHRIFCCSLSPKGSYFEHYFSQIGDMASPAGDEDETEPEYVSLMLSGMWREMSREETLGVIDRDELSDHRNIGVYDMRGSE